MNETVIIACCFSEEDYPQKKVKLNNSMFKCLPKELLKSVFDFYGPLNDHGFDELLELRTLSKYLSRIVLQRIGAKYGWSFLPPMNTRWIRKLLNIWRRCNCSAYTRFFYNY
jgi:hypothetical protein